MKGLCAFEWLMRIDLQDRRLRIAAGTAAFVGLVAWLVPPTRPQSQPSQLLAFARVDSHRDDAARIAQHSTTIYSAAAWKRWYAGEAAPPPAPPPPPVVAPPAAPVRPRPVVQRPIQRPDVYDDDWEEREADHRRWAKQRREDDRLWRESQRDEDRRWARGDERWTSEAEDRAYERRQRRIDRRDRRDPEDDPYYDDGE